MPSDHEIADTLIGARAKSSGSYHRDYGKKTYGEIKRLARARPPDLKARQMKKLIENRPRLDGLSGDPRRQH